MEMRAGWQALMLTMAVVGIQVARQPVGSNTRGLSARGISA